MIIVLRSIMIIIIYYRQTGGSDADMATTRARVYSLDNITEQLYIIILYSEFGIMVKVGTIRYPLKIIMLSDDNISLYIRTA